MHDFVRHDVAARSTPPSSLCAPLRTPEQMAWIHDRFKLDGLERLSRADRDYADSHGVYLPDVAALAHAALTALRVIAENAESWHGPPPDMGHVRALGVIADTARQALGDA